MRQSGLLQKKNNPPPERAGKKPVMEVLRSHRKTGLYIEMADRYLESIGYTEHGKRHCEIVSSSASGIMRELAYPAKDVELAAVAGFLHDIGNMLGRSQHHRMGALLAKEILEEVGFDIGDIGRVMMAIIIHEEDEGSIPDPVAAALLIADKSDVHRSRVRNPSLVGEDIHDRVNYAATESELTVEPDKKLITLSLVIDTRISQVIEYFEIFLSRMTACRRSAKALNCEFHLFINNTRMA